MDNLAKPSPPPSPDAPLPPAPQPAGRSILRILGYIFLGLAFLLLFYGGVAYWGWRTGEGDRLAAIEEEQQELVSRQIELATADIAAEQYAVALRRLDFVLAGEPDHAEAVALHQQATQALATSLTPTVTPTPTATPTATPPPSATPAPDLTREARAQYLLIEELVADESWVKAVEALEDFRILYPDYRRRDVSEMLYDSYVNLGLRLTRGSEIERGISYLEQAAELGDLSEEVLGEIFWAEQYLEGIVFYGIDWLTYLSYFRPMCEFAPLYQNSCGKLADGLLAFAEQQALDLEYCPAEALYREALRTREISLSDIEEQLTFASEICLVATPTPEFDLTLTPEIDNGGVITNSLGVDPTSNGFVLPILTATPEP